MRPLLLVLLLVFAACSDDDPAEPTVPDDPPLISTHIFDHTAVAAFANLTPAACEVIRATQRIYYGHTSHGSQIITGMQMLAAEDACYQLPEFHEVGDDLGTDGDVTWAAATRLYLAAHPGEIDVVMWSWCGGVSGNTVAGIDAYLGAMAALEADHPDITFVYMTGHLDGGGTGGSLWLRNEQIRTWCRDHGKVLFDFAAIEAHDPSGVAHTDGSDACEWCDDWCGSHDCPDCDGCAHSHCYNCYRKGIAFWVLLASLADA